MESVYVLTTGIRYENSWPLRAFRSNKRANEVKEKLESEHERTHGTAEAPSYPKWVDEEDWRIGEYFEIVEVGLR